MKFLTFSTINWLGLWTLYTKEVLRFIKVYNQTLIAPMVTSLLFLAIFSLALDGKDHAVGTVPYQEYVAVGLIIMTIVQNAFATTSSSLIMGKVIGTVIDFLMPPISAGEMVFAMAMAAMTRGFAVGLLVATAIAFFVPLSVHSVALVLFYVCISSLMLGLLGLLTGIVTDSFDQMAAVTSYIITPLAFLSGTFYSVNNLPAFWQNLNYLNPFFYMIDGFRYAMTGYADGPILTGALVLIITSAALYALTHALIARGYRLKT